MIHILLLLVFSAVNTAGVKEGEHCIKGNIPGVCTNIRKCPDAQQDIKNRKPPQICEFNSLDPIVCCVTTSSDINTAAVTETSPVAQKAKCVLPPYLAHGNYIANVEGRPGDAFDLFVINITCSQGYGLRGSQSVFCQDGWWPEKMPKCERVCKLTPHPSVDHSCIVSENGVTGTRECNEFELHGTVVNPHCRAPNYFNPTALKFMHCVDGYWDYYARCIPECGTVTPEATPLLLGAEVTERGEVPWFAGIYSKTSSPYKYICGGTLISRAVIITAAHCFWNSIKNRANPSSEYAAAVGKLYTDWDDIADSNYAQRSDIERVHIPPRFQGAEAEFQDDIALAFVSDLFEYKTYIRPVCLDFDINFEKSQLKSGNKGKVAGWGISEDGAPSKILRLLTMSYVDKEKCIAESPPAIIKLISNRSDKICAGDINEVGKAICIGDSGGGLVFQASERGVQRHYLRGVVSTALSDGPAADLPCNVKAYTAFTQVLKHEHFIKQYWDNYI